MCKLLVEVKCHLSFSKKKRRISPLRNPSHSLSFILITFYLFKVERPFYITLALSSQLPSNKTFERCVNELHI